MVWMVAVLSPCLCVVPPLCTRDHVTELDMAMPPGASGCRVCVVCWGRLVESVLVVCCPPRVSPRLFRTTLCSRPPRLSHGPARRWREIRRLYDSRVAFVSMWHRMLHCDYARSHVTGATWPASVCFGCEPCHQPAWVGRPGAVLLRSATPGMPPVQR